MLPDDDDYDDDDDGDGDDDDCDDDGDDDDDDDCDGDERLSARLHQRRQAPRLPEFFVVIQDV